MELTAEVIYGFTGSLLLSRFDNPKPTPAFHMDLWRACCSSTRTVALAAPRGHAKSTAITHSYSLAAVLFRQRSFVVIVSDTERQATAFVQNIKVELLENQALRQFFGVKTFIKDSESVLEVELEDGHRFRIVAKGAEQKIRGLQWRGKRPDLIVCDDLENDEAVLNRDRREKFRKWFLEALLPAVSDVGIVRVVGTILHMDSLLERLLTDATWESHRFRAHNEDFSEVLWPEKFSAQSLREIRTRYVNQGNPEGYAQEYLNYPIDESAAFFRKEDFLPLEATEENLRYYIAADLAISQKERADFTAFVVCAVDEHNKLRVVDVRRGRWDSYDIMEELFSLHKRYTPELFILEDEKITKALGPFLRTEMFKRGLFPAIHTVTPSKDKQTRARSIQARMRAGGVQFDKEASWFPDLQQEMMRFPRDLHDDQVDALAWIGLTLDKHLEAPSTQELEDEEYEEMFGMDMAFDGRSELSGY